MSKKEKRFRMEMIDSLEVPFIVDNDSAKKLSDKTTSYHTYGSHRIDKCLELVDLMNDLDTFRTGYSALEKQIKQLREENNRLRLLKIHLDSFDEDIEWLKNNTTWATMPSRMRIYSDTDMEYSEKKYGYV